MFLVDWWRVAATVDIQGVHRRSLGEARGREGRDQTAAGQAMAPKPVQENSRESGALFYL